LFEIKNFYLNNNSTKNKSVYLKKKDKNYSNSGDFDIKNRWKFGMLT